MQAGVDVKKLLVLLVTLGITVIAYQWLRPASSPSSRTVQGLPWQIESLPDGMSEVFGLTLGRSTLGDARDRVGGEMELAIVAFEAETGSLEMFYRHYNAGMLSGKLIIAADIGAAALEAMRGRAVKASYMDSGARKFTLHPDDIAAAYRVPIKGITFMPAVRLDQDLVQQRFGPPAETITAQARTTHFLYPDKGLDLMLDESGRAVLQYVAPRAFADLRQPLQKQP